MCCSLAPRVMRESLSIGNYGSGKGLLLLGCPSPFHAGYGLLRSIRAKPSLVQSAKPGGGTP